MVPPHSGSFDLSRLRASAIREDMRAHCSGTMGQIGVVVAGCKECSALHRLTLLSMPCFDGLPRQQAGFLDVGHIGLCKRLEIACSTDLDHSFAPGPAQLQAELRQQADVAQRECQQRQAPLTQELARLNAARSA